MKLRERIINDLINHEGKRNKVYSDTMGIPTIAVGRNLRDVGLSEDEIMYLLNNDIDRVENQLDTYFPWWREKIELVRRMLISFVFNVGIGTARKFPKMMKAIENDIYVDAIKELLYNSEGKPSKYYTQVGRRAKEMADWLEEADVQWLRNIR